MSSEDLPDGLDKLKISPVLPQVKHLDINLPLSLNPFYDAGIKSGIVDPSEQSIVSQMSRSYERRSRPNSCRRLRRNSESVLDDYKVITPLATNHPEDLPGSRMPGVNRSNLKKSSSNINQKIILRQPVLKALRTCLTRPQSSARRKLLIISVDAQPAPAATSTTNRMLPDSQDITGFRDLINECQSLLEQDVDFNGRLNQLTLNNRISKNFTTIQSATPKFRPKISSPLLEGKTDCSNAPSLTTSCSQQAGSSAANVCDDVTIDELASYFDTLVHIPKKMSSMAEMMYT